jgi:predicted RNA-binding Zn ribbon-like protein
LFEEKLYGESLSSSAGRVCLDFANTADNHASDHPDEQLHTYADLVGWAQSIGLLSEEQSGELLSLAEQQPGKTALILEQAISFREVLYRIFAAISHEQTPLQADVMALNEMLARALIFLRFRMIGDGFTWEWSGGEKELDCMLWPVALSAADLLTDETLERVGQCADDRGCGWLFLDMSKNRTRRYCGYGCANRAKAQRHYARKKASGDDDPA